MKAWHCRIIVFALAALLIQAPALAGSVLLYDVDFGTPPHTVGQPPAVGDGPAPRNTVTEIVFGQPLVVAALGALTDQPCAFGDHPTATYDQMRLITQQGGTHGFPEAYPAYHVEMDVLVLPMAPGSTFKIFVDCPLAHSVQFNASNEIRASVLGTGGYNVLIGNYTTGVPLFLEIFADIENQQWTISVDGTPLFTGDYPSDELRDVRPSMATSTTPDPVAIDNVRISGMTGAGPGPFYHCSARNLTGPNQVWVADSSGIIFDQYDQQFGAELDGWGYRDGCGDGTHVYFGWSGGVVRHDCEPPGANGTLMFTTPHPGATWRALAFDPTGDNGNGSIWSASFSSELIEVTLTGAILTVFPDSGWSLYGLAYDPGDGDLWGHDTGGDVIKIDTSTGTIITGVGWATGFPNLAAQGGLSMDDGANRLAAISQGTPDELGAYNLTGNLVFGPIDLEGQSGSNGHLGVAVCPAGGAWDPGDMNCDGVVNAFDIDPFVLALTDPIGYTLAWPNCDILNGDINGDGVVNAFDIDPFVALLIGP